MSSDGYFWGDFSCEFVRFSRELADFICQLVSTLTVLGRLQVA